MEPVMMSPLRLTQLIAALGVLSLTACGVESATAPAPTAPLAPTAAAHDACSGYSVADAKC
jgi:hypothetical protein